jgi:hypothetical protein
MRSKGEILCSHFSPRSDHLTVPVDLNGGVARMPAINLSQRDRGGRLQIGAMENVGLGLQGLSGSVEYKAAALEH